MEKARKEYTKAEAARIINEEERRKQDKIDRMDRTNAAISEALHYKDGLFFQRTADGSVKIMHRSHPSHDYFDLDVTIPSNEWGVLLNYLHPANRKKSK